MSQRVLITGGAGYLGSAVTGRLLSAGWSVTVVDRHLYRHPSLLYCANHPAFDFVRGDVRDESLMKTLLARHDAVIPLAAIVGAKACDADPIATRSINFGAIEMIERLRSKSQPIVSPCTNSGYGTRTGELLCTEETALEPISLYGETKVEAEKLLLDAENTVSLRLATVFGPSPRIRLDLLVNDFTYRAITDGFLVIYEKDFKRNYIHVDDVADCFLFCLENFDSLKGAPYNVGLNDANLSKAELAEAIKKRVPKLYVHFAEVGTDPDKRNYIVSNDKIKAKGFEAKRSLDQGIVQLIKAFAMLPPDAFRNV